MVKVKVRVKEKPVKALRAIPRLQTRTKEEALERDIGVKVNEENCILIRRARHG